MGPPGRRGAAPFDDAGFARGVPRARYRLRSVSIRDLLQRCNLLNLTFMPSARWTSRGRALRACIRAFLTVASVICTTVAHAAILTVTYARTVASGTDSSGVFGLAGQSLAGLDYAAVFHVDTARGSRFYSPPGLDSVIGGDDQGNESPSLGVTLTINGVAFAFNGLNLGLQSNYAARSEIASYANDLAQNGGFNASFIGNAIAVADLPYDMETPYSGTGTRSSGGFTNNFQIAFGPGNLMTQFASGRLSPTSVSVQVGVPEPATWGLMIAGFGLVGVTMRRRTATTCIALG